MKSFSSNINLRYLMKKGKIKKLNLKRYLTSDEVSKLKAQYIDDTYIHHVIHGPTVGYFDGKLVFVYLTAKIVKIPRAVIKQAEAGMGKMRWDKADNSLRKALKGSGGHELHFGWRNAFGAVKQFVPSVKQTGPYAQVKPLIDRMDGIFQRVLPQIWGNQLRGQRSTKFRRSATDVSTLTSIQLLKNAPTSMHVDPKNADDALSVLTTAGSYSGGEFCFPAYGVSIPIKVGDILIAATHREWHCNFKRVEGLRYAIIGYFAENLKNR